MGSRRPLDGMTRSALHTMASKILSLVSNSNYITVRPRIDYLEISEAVKPNTCKAPMRGRCVIDCAESTLIG